MQCEPNTPCRRIPILAGWSDSLHWLQDVVSRKSPLQFALWHIQEESSHSVEQWTLYLNAGGRNAYEFLKKDFLNYDAERIYAKNATMVQPQQQEWGEICNTTVCQVHNGHDHKRWQWIMISGDPRKKPFLAPPMDLNNIAAHISYPKLQIHSNMLQIISTLKAMFQSYLV